MSNPGPLNLLDERGVDFLALVNKSTQEPGHLQDLVRDLMIRFSRSGISWN